ncbi:MAG: sulfotransferase family 2 domain-containing protein [Wenzhouxiangellaceae bacterium]|nr:sulfotransferase family 2 domain-containing protein [Wenzhouxiangellaceae bacterium]
MIISHRHRFIFLHCRKVAGSSIAAALAPYLGPNDLHLGTWPEALAAGVRPNKRAWQDLLHPIAGASFIGRLLQPRRGRTWLECRTDALNGAQRLKYRRSLGHSPEHAHARCVREFDPVAWRDYFKFCFVRNPFDRAVSDFRWRTAKRGGENLSLGAFLDCMQRGDFRHPAIPHHFDNWPIYTIDDRIAVDFVGRFEQLESDLTTVFDRLGLNKPTLPHAKASGRRSADYRACFGAAERAQVETLFGRELETFGYTF